LRNFAFFGRDETQAFVAGKDGMIIVAFRGTELKKLQDWLTDADFELVDGPLGKVPDGFYRALRLVWCELLQAVHDFQDTLLSLWLTGHRLGAALATLATAILQAEDKPVYGLYTFG
jgi:triacylglycerol lipase